MSDRSLLTHMERRALERMDRRREELLNPRPPVVYVVRYRYGPNAPILGVYGRVTEAEAAARADAEDTGQPLQEYVTTAVEFHGKLHRRPRKGECDE